MSDEVPASPPGGLPAVVDAVTQLLRAAGGRPDLVEVTSGALAVRLEWRDGVRPAPAGLDLVPATAADDFPAAPGPVNGAGHYFTAPLVGVFYRAREPGAEPFVDVGDQVVEGQQIAIIEAMKLMLPVEADQDGVISEVLQCDASPVEYGTRLFAVAAAAS